mmetsp:Transcript_5724/g.11703  ORF Transcript_5724/g.11703 Transcript_5724/m.11703 type:complete len:417 (+) Transcript_5724:90-1340(+)
MAVHLYMSKWPHQLLLLLLLLSIVVVLLLILLLLVFGLLGIVLLLFLALFQLAELFPFLRKAISLGLVVGDDDVVEDGPTLDLPQIKANEAEVLVLVHAVVVLVLWVGDSLCLPDALVGRVGDPLPVPLALVGRVVLHRSLPLTVLLVIPVVGLLRIAVHCSLLLNPVVGLLVLRIVNHGLVRPVIGLLVSWIWNLLRLQDLPVLLDGALVDLLLINLDPNCVVRLQNHPVHVRGALTLLLVCQVRLLQDVLALVVENKMCPRSITALVGAEHEVVNCGVAKGGGIRHLGADLDITPAALHVLLVLGLVLDDEILASVAEGVKRCGDAKKLGVLSGLKTRVLCLVLEPLARGGCPLSLCALAFLPLAGRPAALPAATKSLREVDLARGKGQGAQAECALHRWRFPAEASNQTKLET